MVSYDSVPKRKPNIPTQGCAAWARNKVLMVVYTWRHSPWQLGWHDLPSVLVLRRPEAVYDSCSYSLHWQQETTLIPFQYPAPTPQYGSLFCENHIFSLLSWEAKYKSILSQSLFQQATVPTAIVSPKSITGTLSFSSSTIHPRFAFPLISTFAGLSWLSDGSTPHP